MEKKVLMIAMDIDGTLLKSNGDFHPDNVTAVKRAQESGVITVIASGRSPGNIYLMLQEQGLFCPMIAVNGAQSADENMNTFALHPMRPDAAEAVSDYLLSRDVPFFMMGEGFICTSEEKMRHHSELLYGDRLPELGHLFFHGPAMLRERASGGRILKFFVPAHPDIPRIREEMKRIRGIDLTRSNPNNIEILPHGVDKAVGLEDMAAHYKIPMENVMTVGDEENDLPMLRRAGLSVAMGNAPEIVRAQAACVTLTNDAGGVAAAIERLVLNKQ